MSTTSPNFNLILATTSDQVSVTSHISNNFSTMDSVMAVAHTGTGQHKSSLPFTTPVLINPQLSGTLSGGNIVIASTGRFNTITATAGALTVSTFNIGTFAFPTTVGSAGFIMVVQTGNLVFASQTPNTGANLGLSNLASVAINTNLNTFTAGFVTADRLVVSSGALTGLTSFQASAGTFAGNVTISGTATINAVNCTGGAGTFASITVGTWALPSTLGSAGQILRVSAGAASFTNPIMTSQTAFCFINQSTADINGVSIVYLTELYDLGNNAVTGAFTAPASGIYEFNFSLITTATSTVAHTLNVAIQINTTQYSVYNVAHTGVAANTANPMVISGSIINTVASGAVVTVFATDSGSRAVVLFNAGGFFSGKRLFEF